MKRHHTHTPLSRILPDVSADAARAIRRTVKIGCAINILLMAMKLTAGYLGHSDALMADGFHSLNDVAADIIMLVFIGVSYRKPDARYAYGYGKFETFSTFTMSVFLIILSVMIGTEAVEKITDYAHGAQLEQPDIWTFVIVLIAMGTKEGLYRFYSHTGAKVDSTALQANAWHHRSDALASVATLIGVTFSHFFGPAFRILDPVATLVIALFILIPAIGMLRPSFGELMERSLPSAEVRKAIGIITATPGVLSLDSLRTRRVGHNLVFDAAITVAPNTTVETTHALSQTIRSELKKAFCPHIHLALNISPAVSD